MRAPYVTGLMRNTGETASLWRGVLRALAGPAAVTQRAGAGRWCRGAAGPGPGPALAEGAAGRPSIM